MPGTEIIFWMYSCTQLITLNASERDMAEEGEEEEREGGGGKGEGRRRRRREGGGAAEEEGTRKRRTARGQQERNESERRAQTVVDAEEGRRWAALLLSLSLSMLLLLMLHVLGLSLIGGPAAVLSVGEREARTTSAQCRARAEGQRAAAWSVAQWLQRCMAGECRWMRVPPIFGESSERWRVEGVGGGEGAVA